MDINPGPEDADAPPLRALRGVWSDYLAGVAEEHDLILTLQAFEDLAQLQLDGLQGQLDRGESDPDDPIFAEIMAAFETQKAAVNRMFMEFEEPEKGHFEAGYALAQKATNRLHAQHLKLTELSEAPCPFCQSRNPMGSQKCANCARPLPGTVHERAVNPGQGRATTENHALLVDTFAGWRSGVISDSEVEERLQFVEDRLWKHRKANQHEPTDTALGASLDALAEVRRAWESNIDTEPVLEQFGECAQRLLTIYDSLVP